MGAGGVGGGGGSSGGLTDVISISLQIYNDFFIIIIIYSGMKCKEGELHSEYSRPCFSRPENWSHVVVVVFCTCLPDSTCLFRC